MGDRIVNFYTVTPGNLKPGDVLVCIVTAHVMNLDSRGNPVVQMYRCRYPYNQVPQGNKIYNAHEVSKELFPVLHAGVYECDCCGSGVNKVTRCTCGQYICQDCEEIHICDED